MEKAKSKAAIVYMAAGMSSRFGGKIKQFAQVGPNGETLMEVSMQQALGAGFDEIIFIVGEKTEAPFREKFGNSYKGKRVLYARQKFDSATRDKPWGTVDALVSAKKVISSSFVVCNGDDLYGEDAMKKSLNFLLQSSDENECCAISYELGKVIPEKGKTNRGIFLLDRDGNVGGIKEVFNVERSYLAEQGLDEKSPVSMNLFCLKQRTLSLLEEKLSKFKAKHPSDRKAECLLPVELGNLINEKKIRMKLTPTSSRCPGITNPEDEEVLRKELSKKR